MISLAAVAIATLVACEIALRLPLGSFLLTLRRTPSKVVQVVGSERISDDWKEKVLPAYAARILRASLGLFACLLAIAAPVIAAATLAEGGLAAGTALLFRVGPLAVMIAVGAGYVALRSRVGAR